MQTSFNYRHKGYEPKGPGSMTIPGQTLSLKQVQERFRRGQSVNVQSYPAVYNPLIPPGLENLNVLDRKDLARQQAAKVSSMRAELAHQKDEEAKNVETTVLPQDTPKPEEKGA